MCKALILFFMMWSIQVSAAETSSCYHMSTDAVQPALHGMILTVSPKNKKSYYLIEVTARDKQNKFWSSQFFCEKKSDECFGDDDSGRFSVEISESTMQMKLIYLNMGDAEEPGPEVRPLQGNRSQVIEGKIIPCFTGNKAQ